MAERGQQDVAAARASAPASGRDLVGDRQHVDAERGEAADGEAAAPCRRRCAACRRAARRRRRRCRPADAWPNGAVRRCDRSPPSSKPPCFRTASPVRVLRRALNGQSCARPTQLGISRRRARRCDQRQSVRKRRSDFATVCRNSLQISQHRRRLVTKRRKRADQAERDRDEQRAKCRSRRRSALPGECAASSYRPPRARPRSSRPRRRTARSPAPSSRYSSA